MILIRSDVHFLSHPIMRIRNSCQWSSPQLYPIVHKLQEKAISICLIAFFLWRISQIYYLIYNPINQLQAYVSRERLMINALSILLSMSSSRWHTFSFKRALSIVRTCSKSITESFTTPYFSASI